MTKSILIFGAIDGQPGVVTREQLRAWLAEEPEETTTTDPPPPPPPAVKEPVKEPDRPVPVAPPVLAPPAVVVPSIPMPSVSQMEHSFIGTQKNTGNPMFLIKFPDQVRLVEDHSDGRLEKISVCGFDIAIDLLPGVPKPTGPETQGWGFNTPPDFSCPADYVEGAFPVAKGGRKFFTWKYYQEPEQATEAETPLHLTIVADYELKGNS